jgi:hypothetical protein
VQTVFLRYGFRHHSDFINRTDGTHNTCTPRTIKSIAKTIFITADLLTARDNAIRKINIISSGPLSGSEEEKLVYFNNNDDSNISANKDEHSQRNDNKRNVPHRYVTAGRRLITSAVRRLEQSIIST